MLSVLSQAQEDKHSHEVLQIVKITKMERKNNYGILGIQIILEQKGKVKFTRQEKANSFFLCV